MAEANVLSRKVVAEEERCERKLTSELEAFERLKPALLATHRGLFVAIHHGAVIATGADDFHLAAQLEDRATREGPIAICKVSENDEADREPACALLDSPPMEEHGR